MGTIPTTRDVLMAALYDTVAEAMQQDTAHARDGGIRWSVDRDRIAYDAHGFLHTYPFEQVLATQIREIQICVEHGWPWWHALSEPWLCWVDDLEFVGAQGGLTYDRDTGTWS